MSRGPRWPCLVWIVCEVGGLSAMGVGNVLQAQTGAESHLAVSIGPEWVGRADLGGRDASLTRNPSGEMPLFDAQSTLAGGTGVSGSLAKRLTRHLWVEALGRYHSARLSTTVTRDVEARTATASEAIQHLVIEAGVLWMPASWRRGDRVQLYGVGGLGYLRQLHESGTLAETGRSYHAGGGVVLGLPTRPGGTFKASGVRIEVRAAAMTDGVAFGGGVHVAPAVWTALFLRF